MATYDEALALYRHAVEMMEDATDRMDEIDALPGWLRWLHGWERRRLEQIFFEFDAQLALLQVKMEAATR
jgi:hypothetical protein